MKTSPSMESRQPRAKGHPPDLLEAIADTVPSLVYLYDLRSGENVYANRLLSEFLSDPALAKDEPKCLLSIMHPQDVPRAQAHLADMQGAKDGEKYDFEYRVCLPEDKERSIISTHRVYERDRDGRPVVLVGAARDVSGERQAEKQASAHYRQFLEHVNDVICIFDAASNLIDVNHIPEPFTHVRSDAQGQAWRQTVPQHAADALDANIASVAADGIPREWEIQFEAVPGQIRAYRNRVARMAGRDGQELFLVTSSEITDLRSHEREAQHHRELIEGVNATAPLLLYVYDLKQQANVFTNRELFEDLGYTTEAFRALENGVLDILHPDDIQGVIRHQSLLANAKDGEKLEFEYRVLDPKGEVRWYKSWDAVFKRSASGEVELIVGAAQDITAEKEARSQLDATLEALREQREDLKQSNRNLEEFAYIASHDLQEPIRNVSQYLQLLNMTTGEDLSDHHRKLVDSAVRGANRMRDLIAGLLEVSKVGRADISYAKVDVQELFSNVTEVMRNRLLETQGTFSHDRQVGEISCDPVLMEQLFTNLVSNGLKFRAPERDPEVYLGYKYTPGEHHFWAQDNGIGIPEEQQGRVFQLFQRGHVREDYSGHGIGLTICKRIVERHRGRIWIESHANRGTAVHFTIPDNLANLNLAHEKPLAH